MDGTTATALFDGITSEMFTGVLDGVLEVIPIIIPVAIGFLAFRKGWSFLMGFLKRA